MAASIIATVGATNANSFGTLAEANTYHETVVHVDGAWDDVDADIKQPALIMAQQQMTSLICWTGYIANSTQKLPWPRNGMWERNELVYILSNVIPDEVKWCQFELARLLATTDRTLEYEVGVNGILRLKAGSVTIQFKDQYLSGPAVIPSVAYNLLVPSWYDSVAGMPVFNRDLERA